MAGPFARQETQAIPRVESATTQAIPRPDKPATQAIPKMGTQAIPKMGTQAIPKMDKPVTQVTQQIPRTQPIPKQSVPGMTEADINALHAKYVKAKEMVGEKVEAGSREKLLKTIQQTAPKIMEQYKAQGVDFSVVVKDNQVVIKAKPKL